MYIYVYINIDSQSLSKFRIFYFPPTAPHTGSFIVIIKSNTLKEHFLRRKVAQGTQDLTSCRTEVFYAIKIDLLCAFKMLDNKVSQSYIKILHISWFKPFPIRF